MDAPPQRSLLQSLQALLERTYRMETGVVDIGRYVIGDQGYELFYGSPQGQAASREDVRRRWRPSEQRLVAGIGRTDRRAQVRAVRPREAVSGPDVVRPPDVRTVSLAAARMAQRSAVGATDSRIGARVLVRDGPGGLSAHIYYPDSLIRALEEEPPGRGIGDRNIDAFATFVEELDHFLVIAERARLGRHVSLLELEMHANVTKYLVCALFLSAGRHGDERAPLGAQRRMWLLWHLFEKAEYAEPDPDVQARYRDAARFARRFLDRLECERSASARLARLRSFHDSTHQEKLAAALA